MRNRNTVLNLFIVSSLLLIPGLLSAQTTTFTRPLHVGSRGADVVTLQELLKAQGFFTYPTATGFFGALTKGAVAQYQAANGLEQVGSVGPLTRALLNQTLASDTGATNSSAPSSSGSGTNTHSVSCTAPAGLTCIPGTSIVQPASPGNGYTPGFGGGGTANASSNSNNTTPAPASVSIAGVSASAATGSSTISWTTNNAATSQLSFGTTTAYGSTTPVGATLSTSHSVVLSNLVAGTTYHYVVASVDANGSAATSSDATFTTGTLALNSRVVFLGDSITAGSSGPSFIYPSMMYADGRYYAPPTANQGIGGNTTAQMLARIASSTTLLPKVLVILGGTNDITGLGSTATQIEANLRSIYDTVEANGTQVVAVTITPRSDTTWNTDAVDNEAVRTAVNSWIKSQTDITAVDMDAAGFDSTTMTVEGLHPNRAGAYLIGSKVGAAMAALADPSSMLYTSTSDWSDLLLNNDLLGQSGTVTGVGNNVSGQVATGWRLSTNVGGISVVGSKATTTDGYAKQIVTITGTATSSGTVTFYRDQSYTGSAGEVYDLWAGVSVSGLSGPVKGFLSSSDGSELWESSSGATSTSEFSGVVRNLGKALTGSDSSSRVQYGLYISPGTVTATFTVSRPTWRKVPDTQ